MSLFQKSVINKYLKTLDSVEVGKSFLKFKEFYGNSARLENIRLLKEENYQEGFLREIFVQVLGYTINPDENYNLTTEFKNLTDAKKADGAILDDGKAIGVIELKSTKTTSLESINEQAFNYKNHQPDCRYIITSNFEKIRFYIDNATDFEEFNLFTLSEADFKILYLILGKESIFNEIPLKLKKESVFHEENISKQLYRDYSQFKRRIFENLVKNNPQFDKLMLFKKSQKLLDRFLFILFGEDSGLVPPNSISIIIDQWKALEELDEAVSLYSRFLKFFHYLDIGHKYKTFEVPAYNGGLFREDEVLNIVQIDDEILLNDSLKLSSYDFQTEIDVNILGHIFENSLNEIEELTAELEGKAVDKKKTKRKKEGVYYTPKYITKYIVENTVGKLCNQKKIELKLDEIEISIIQNSRTKQGKLNQKAVDLLKRLKMYSDYLLSLKILDPACGSGAFLNQALEFLIEEHQFVDEYRRQLEKDSLGLYNIKKSILENNIYGVDINEESVEIAKLSLWLRTAERGRKLSDLSNNIKCGNSLIDDPEVAGEKAFKWEEEFPEIMANGGFDVVIGNPPYVNANILKKMLSKKEYLFLKNNYQTAKGTVDLYIYFFELAFKLVKENSYIAYITPNRYLSVSYGKALRFFLLNNSNIQSIIDYSDVRVFKDASTYPIVSIFSKNYSLRKYNFKVGKYSDSLQQIINSKSFNSSKLELLNDYIWGFLLNDKIKITEKIVNKSIQLSKVCKINATSTTKEADEFHSLINDSDGMKLINTGTIDRYIPLWGFSKLVDKGKKFLTPYLANTALISENRLKQYKSPKIVFAKIALRTEAFFDEKGEYCSINTNCIHSFNRNFNPKYILAFVNSKLFQYTFECFFDGLKMAGGYLLYSAPNLSNMYIKEISEKEEEYFVEQTGLLTDANFQLIRKINKFKSILKANFDNMQFSRRIGKFYEYNFHIFLKELKKQKIVLDLKSQDEWEEYFQSYKTEILDLQSEIKICDKNIDNMIYELYDLTESEIQIVENNLKFHIESR